MSHPDTSTRPQILRQPVAVWAVAFAAVVSFMGIGLVDPILPAIAGQLGATKAQTLLLFTSYLGITGLAMLLTGWVSSRFGAKKTLMTGLVLIVAFAALAGSSGSIAEIVGFRAGWGLGNALFIATALATIVGAASGGTANAIILYEAALGLGIATGPLLGGLLGEVSWRGPFFGTAVLMAIAFIAIATLLPATPRPAVKTSVKDPVRALRHPGLRTVAVMAFLYNFGFFTLLAYTPFALGISSPTRLGLVFFGWGVCLAVASVALAPRLQRRFGAVPVVSAMLALFALVLVVEAVFVETRTVLVVGTIVAGVFLGVNNTIVTELVMEVSPVQRSTASAAYSCVRFIGGAIAAWAAGELGEVFTDWSPFVLGALGVAVGLLVLTAGRRHLAVAHHDPAPHSAAEAQAVTAGDA
ncbi:MFS transporter [Kineococcus aurantiacus]|uniref:Putative MFS family arabinose efflux permease n=1 Tax=Kineococcus aurantiacus TaxID=37633 RepID=A0A7Y9DM65_9ACTN|nr:putative MFS family arabinose efflux permease [Kineococcus aurantiacus]